MSHTDQAFIKAFVAPKSNQNKAATGTKKTAIHTANHSDSQAVLSTSQEHDILAELDAEVTEESQGISASDFSSEGSGLLTTEEAEFLRTSGEYLSAEDSLQEEISQQSNVESNGVESSKYDSDSDFAFPSDSPIAPIKKSAAKKTVVKKTDVNTSDAINADIIKPIVKKNSVGPLADLSSSGNVAETLQPQTVLDELELPEICVSLLDVAESGFDSVVKKIEKQVVDGTRLLLVSTCKPKEGGTTFTICLAKLLSESGLKVAVVEGNFQSPALAEQLQLLPKADWLTVLQGDASLADALVETKDKNLAFLPLALSPVEGTEWENEPRLRLCLGLLRRDYDLVLIDGGPINASHPRPIGWPQVDAGVIIHDPNHSSEADLAATEDYLHQAGVTELGIIQNFI